MKIFGKIILAILEPLTSRKLWMTVIGLAVMNALYWTSVYYLYSFTNQWMAQLFYNMFNSVCWTTSMIVLGYLGLQTIAGGWTNSSASVATSAIQSLFEKKEETIHQVVEVRVPGAKHFDGDDIP